MGDLVQTLPLIQHLAQDGSVELLCDTAVEDWARLLPDVDRVISVDTRHWREASSDPNCDLDSLVSELDAELNKVEAERLSVVYALNDHPAGDALAGWICRQDQRRWLSPGLVLLRSYIRLIAADRKWNRLHLSDLWVYLAGAEKAPRGCQIQPTKSSGSFARSIRQNFQAPGAGKSRRIWVFVLGSGAKHRRLDPEDFAALYDAIPASRRPVLALVGGPGEEDLSRRFRAALGSGTEKIINLVGNVSPEELLGVFSAADLLLGVDTGPLHWAAAVGSKVFGFYFGEAGLSDTGPYGEGHFVLVPDCCDYPCSPEKARSCDYRCRTSYKEAAGIAKLLLAISSGDFNEESHSIPPGLRLYRSYGSPVGIRFKALNGSGDPPEISLFENFTRRVFSQNQDELRSHRPECNHNYLPGRWRRTDQRDSKLLYRPVTLPNIRDVDDKLDVLFGRWRGEIIQLPLPTGVPAALLDNVKAEALRRLETARCVPDSISVRAVNLTQFYPGQTLVVGGLEKKYHEDPVTA